MSNRKKKQAGKEMKICSKAFQKTIYVSYTYSFSVKTCSQNFRNAFFNCAEFDKTLRIFIYTFPGFLNIILFSPFSIQAPRAGTCCGEP